MSKRGWTILSIFLLLGVGTTCYFLFAGEREDPNLAPLKEEIKKIQSQNLSPQQMMAAHMQIREKAKGLSESAQRELRHTFGEGMRKVMDQRMDAYFKAPEAQRNAILDQQIREMEAMRTQMMAMRQQGGGPGGFGGRRGGGADGDSGGPRGEAAGQGGSGGGPGNRGNMSEEQRDQRRKDHMEHGDPQERSRRMEYMSAIRDRRKELGLPDMRPPRGH